LLAAECEEPALVIVPSRDGLGTNAILRMPPALFPSHFGEGSYAKHVGEAERIGARVILRSNTRLEMDVDDEADLRALLQNDLSSTETGRWLRESGVETRLRSSKEARARFAAKG
jgi:2-phospho-L-lactate guanylyltransferase (CobY/MobA/RfbA family)